MEKLDIEQLGDLVNIEYVQRALVDYEKVVIYEKEDNEAKRNGKSYPPRPAGG